ncbi:MAG: LysR family transcriptional regulator [Gammaproteobacteria bacterium]|nr:LysR family transcriptional regulator [Gammaproteobacteria bacterium]MCP5409293.1 LysR family transcriptional regulator [Chromatiaceae bacterium]MCP5444699.1 LysR family transcriptional regulator [Chromatiaceae bacterium]
MELRQLRSLEVLVESGFSVTLAAERLHLVQSAVSQHLSRLERELETELFVRQGKRLMALTDTGELVLQYARRILNDTENILAVGRDQEESVCGELRIGTTHTQARYVLAPVIRVFREIYPQVNLQIHQGTPQQLVEMADSGSVDFSICTEALGEHPNLTALHCYRWNRSLIAPKGHPVLERRPLALDTLCEYPLITYVFGFTGANHFRTSFARLGLKPRVVLSAADTDVIKTYVREGFGVGIIASLAYSSSVDSDLQVRDLSRLFPWEVTRIAYNKGKYLRRYERRFIELMQNMVADNGVVLTQSVKRRPPIHGKKL